MADMLSWCGTTGSSGALGGFSRKSGCGDLCGDDFRLVSPSRGFDFSLDSSSRRSRCATRPSLMCFSVLGFVRGVVGKLLDDRWVSRNLFGFCAIKWDSWGLFLRLGFGCRPSCTPSRRVFRESSSDHNRSQGIRKQTKEEAVCYSEVDRHKWTMNKHPKVLSF